MFLCSDLYSELCVLPLYDLCNMLFSIFQRQALDCDQEALRYLTNVIDVALPSQCGGAVKEM